MDTNTDQHKPTIVTDGQPRKSKGSILIAAAVAVLFLGGAMAYLRNHTVGDADVSELDAAQVQITEKGFSPATVKLKKGQQLTWINSDGTAHQIASADKNAPELQPDTAIEPQNSLTATMEHDGTFTYYDSLHNTDFKGTIIVE